MKTSGAIMDLPGHFLSTDMSKERRAGLAGSCPPRSAACALISVITGGGTIIVFATCPVFFRSSWGRMESPFMHTLPKQSPLFKCVCNPNTAALLGSLYGILQQL